MKPNKIFKTLIVIILALLAACNADFGTIGSGVGGGNYTISFNSQGGEYCSARYGNYGVEISLPYTYRDGYIFLGWYSSVSGGGIYYGFEGDTYKITSNETLYAHWESDFSQSGIYRISFETLGGTNISDRKGNYGDKIILPKSSRNGYYFDGWLDSFGAYYAAGDNYTITCDKIFYANWVLGNCLNLSAPTGISASAVSENTINISWNAVNGAEYYEIYFEGSFLDNVKSTSYTDYSPLYILPSTTYSYAVKAVNSCSISPFSNTVFVTTPSEKRKGTLVIKNISSFNITEVLINYNDYGAISKYSSGSYELEAGNYFLEVIDDYGDYFSAFVTISAGQTKTFEFAYNGFQ